MMRVRMLKQTYFDGSKMPGDIIIVDDAVAKRWQANGIAEMVIREGQELKETIPEPEQEPEQELEDDLDPDVEDPFEGKSAKQLYELCVEQEIEVEPKKSRAYYIDKLSGN